MIYPRTIELNGEESLVADDQMVGYKEHLTQKHRILFMTGVFAGETDSHNLLMALDTLSHAPIKLVITSAGGELDSAFLLYDTMKLVCSPIITIGRYCASAAAMLLAAGKKRYLLPHAKVMLHLPSSFFSKDTAIQLQDMEIIHRESRKYKERMVEILLECGVKKSREELLVDIDRDFWLDPKEAIAYGLADEILTPKIWQEMIREKVG